MAGVLLPEYKNATPRTDAAAGAALCMAAGLRVTDVLGNPMPFNQRDPHIRGLLVAEPGLHERIRSHIARYIR